MLSSPYSGYERILLYGSTGTSKTYSWLNIARWSQRTKSPALFHCLDTDNAITDQLDQEFSDLKNVIVTPAYE